MSDKQTFVERLHNSKLIGIRAQAKNQRLQLIVLAIKVAQLRAAVLRSPDN